MLKVKKGDLEKLSLLYHRYSRRVFGFFYRLTGDGATSEDLVQNVFMRILKYKHTYSEDGKFETWIFHMARNIHHDHYKKYSRYSWQEDMGDWEAKLSDEKNAEVAAEKSDELSMLRQALQSLTPEKRELIEMTRFQKMKYEQVANLLGVTESAVKVRVHRILKELRQAYLKLEV
ncbi:MAG: sigma-70 family RNA polymerase sigma factor [Cytophagales bacterium]|nr:sigma-70 family RNA polymerase sigma factor [Cytophagales bacterium]